MDISLSGGALAGTLAAILLLFIVMILILRNVYSKRTEKALQGEY